MAEFEGGMGGGEADGEVVVAGDGVRGHGFGVPI